MILTSINFDKPGKQQGFLQIPYSHNLGGWANVMIPITVVSAGKGPTALILGGNHGDEYQGQIAAMNLARELDPAWVSGRIILIPSLNFPAARAATRLSPLDGMNLNRAFPGDAEGPVTSQIAIVAGMTAKATKISKVTRDLGVKIKIAASAKLRKRKAWTLKNGIVA